MWHTACLGVCILFCMPTKVYTARAAFIFLQVVIGNDKLVHLQPALSKSQWGSAVQGGVVTRELSFGLSSPQAGVKKENGAPPAGVKKQENGAPVQHVESLGAWAQNEAHRKPSIKLEGQSSMPSTDSCQFFLLFSFVLSGLFSHGCL